MQIIMTTQVHNQHRKQHRRQSSSSPSSSSRTSSSRRQNGPFYLDLRCRNSSRRSDLINTIASFPLRPAFVQVSIFTMLFLSSLSTTTLAFSSIVTKNIPRTGISSPPFKDHANGPFQHLQQRQGQQRLGTGTTALLATARSDRLDKAKLLLEQLVNDNDDEMIAGSNDIATATAADILTSTKQPSPPFANGAMKKNGITKQQQPQQQPTPLKKNGAIASTKPLRSSSSSIGRATATKGAVTINGVPRNGGDASTTPVVVPDVYWNNGHLMQNSNSSIVTRWARGVKVAEPLVKYDPVAAEKLLFRQPAKWIVRNIQIAFPIGFWAVSVALDYVTGQSSSSERRKQRASQLRRAITDLGPAIIKGGQALASRPDLLPSEYLEELQKLQDDVPRFSNELALKTVEEELGIKFEDVFELIQEEPVAAASIGQVYKARLLANDDTVALKIQRPGCEEIIALDLYVLRWWSGIYNNIFRLLQRDIDVQSIIDDFGELIYREIDYVAEAANAQRFNELYAGVKDVFVPKIYSDYTTNKVLTMEWVDGFRLTDKAALAQYGLDNSRLVDTLVQCSLRQILENGFFHADPHAGNLLAQPDGRLCYLDFGMMSYATSTQRNGFLLAVVHIVNRDWPELVRLYVRLGFIPEDTDLKPIEIALDNAMPDVLNADVSELNFKNVIGKLGDIMYTYPFSLPPFYIAIIRCLGVLEGLAIQVDPEAKILSEAYPYVASRVLTDKQPELQEAFRRLALTNDGHIRWDRLESLLDEAKDSAGYDVASALDLLTEYLLADESGRLLSELSQQIVDAADNLGAETFTYVMEASRALVVNDEVGAVRAFQGLQDIIRDFGSEDGVAAARKRVREDLQNVLPEPTPSMKQFGRILALLGAQSDQTDPAKFVPIIRKLSAEPRIQNAASEIVARLGERLLSRSLRVAFGLPAPEFGRRSDRSTVTEDRYVAQNQ